MKARAKARMKERRSRFVVGYIGAGNLLFTTRRHATRHLGDNWLRTDSIHPMTRREAQRLLAKMPCADCAIFELVPVEVNQ